ncbi:MAG: substrate-binding domain-containing protein [Lachnospiraceae bacterium]|nr:substrate-binding domain-containing protein [Lachnospiraceae bacterium]
MNKKYVKTGIVLVSALLLFSGCTQSAGNLSKESHMVEGLKELGTIRVISREDGSGTRSTFAELAGFQGEGEVGNNHSDLTTENAVIVNNADEVIRDVAADISAIGYVSKAAISGNGGVKSLKVEGKSPEQGEKYPLNRDFYLAYSGTLSDLERDFLTYVHGAGQEIVGKDYDTVAKNRSFLSNLAKGKLEIEGSTSVAPLMEQLAEAYEKINTNAAITVTATDSTKGLTQVMAGKCDFGMSSRELKDYEMELLDYESIARDNIVVIVEKNNPLDDISLEDLKEIYTGKIKNWDELNQQ